MAFKGITFAGQNVTPKNDGGLYQAHYGDGILWGCSMAISGDDLVIQSGEFIMGGRVVQVDGATNVDLSGRLLSTGYIQVIMNADMSQGEGSQWYTSFVESATTTFPDLTKDDINDNGNLYQLELAVVQISGGNLTSVYSHMPYSGIIVNNGNSRFINDTNVNIQQELQFYVNGDYKGKIFATAEGPDLMRVNASGTSLNGLAIGEGATLSADGDDIQFRPNGWNNSTGQVSVTPTGQIVGGALSTSTSGSNKSVSANTLTGIGSLALDSSGKYIVFASLAFTSTSASGTHRIIGLSSVSGALGVNQNTSYTASSGQLRYSICLPWEGFNVVWLNFNPGSYGGTVNAWEIRALRIA